MKTPRHKILSSIFLLVFLSAFSSGLYISLSNSLPELAHFSAHKELKSTNNSKSGSNEFLYEENETESETELGLELQALVLPFFVSSFYSLTETNVNFNFTFCKPLFSSEPIYVSIRNFRI